MVAEHQICGKALLRRVRGSSYLAMERRTPYVTDRAETECICHYARGDVRGGGFLWVGESAQCRRAVTRSRQRCVGESERIRGSAGLGDRARVLHCGDAGACHRAAKKP